MPAHPKQRAAVTAVEREQREAFGARVKARRDELQLSQEQFAELVGIHRTYVGSVEQGRRNISLDNIYRFSRALQVHAKDLL